MRSDVSVELVLLVPGLLGPGAAGAGDPASAQALVAGLDLDGLDRLLARAVHTGEKAADESLEALAFRSFGHAAPPAGADWPVAALTALVDGFAEEGVGVRLRADGFAEEGSRIRLRADPVHLRADIDDLVLFDASDIDLSPDEAEALARTVNDALAPHGPRIEAAHPHRWYVAPDAPARIATTPLSRAAGTPVSDALPRGPDAARWHRWMNEVQMALHECPVNVERERRGAAPVNSVWVWGAGSLPPAGGAPAPFVQVWTDDALLRGLARHAGVERGANPAGAEEWLGGGPRPGAKPAGAEEWLDGGPRSGANPAGAEEWLGGGPRPGAHPAGAEEWLGGGPRPGAHPAGAEEWLGGGPRPGAHPAGAEEWLGGGPRPGAHPAGAEEWLGGGPRPGAHPAGAEEWLGGGPRPGVHLAVFDDLYPAVRRADIDAWRAGLARLSRSWAQPLLDALNRGGVSRVVIHDERGNRFAATRGGRFRWWRRAGLAARIAGARGPNA